MLRADAAGVDTGGFTGFGQRVVAGVEIFALFQVFG
jgi:hypothetical protein